jgi:3-methyladenine DNA glycosylase AlkD
MQAILEDLRRELIEQSDETIRAGATRYFKEPILCYGSKTATVTAIARRYWKRVAPLGKERVFELCEDLYRTDYMEEAFVAAVWVPRLANDFEPEDIDRFARWIDLYINNWAKCDGFCNHAVGDFVTQYPWAVEHLKEWARSENRWMRRAAAVSLIVPAKRGEFLDDVFAIADLLLLDRDDLVQKGYGWLLKEGSRRHRNEVFDYVLRHRTDMPRTALRYAIELMPTEMRKEAMRKV